MADLDDDRSDDEDQVEALFSPIKLDNILRALYFGSALQIILSIATMIVASRSDNAHGSQTNFIASGIIIAASMISTYSCFYRDRGGLQWSYLLLVWAVGNGTRYLYAALLDSGKLDEFCGGSGSSEDAASNCTEQQSLAASQMGLAIVQFFASLTNAWLTSNLSEKIQDHENIVQRKKDIRFALAAQAQKHRTIKKWKNAFQSVSLGSKLKKKVGLMKGGSIASLAHASVPDKSPSSPLHVVDMKGQGQGSSPLAQSSSAPGLVDSRTKGSPKPSPLNPLSYDSYSDTNLGGVGVGNEGTSSSTVTQRRT